MKDINLTGLNNIKADKELIERTVNKVMNNSKSKKYFNIKKSAAVAASLMVIAGATSLYALNTKGDLGKEVSNKNVVVADINVDKAVIDNKVTTDKTIVESMVVANEDAKNSNETSIKPNLNSKSTPSKATENANMTPSTPTKNSPTPSNNLPIANNGITIPAINLTSTDGVHGKMLALVVYNGKVYLQSTTELVPNNIKNFLGEKIGRTTNSIDEWNVSDKSSQEMASNIGEQDIYTVKGYDNDFRIMSYSIYEGQEFAQFFDCLNGVTIKSGKDIFGKLNLVNNLESAKFIGFEDWNNGTNNYTSFSDVNLMNEFLIELNSAVPYNYETVEKDIDSARNNSGFREFTLKLKNGLEVKFTAFKNGYVSCGYSNIYFKVKGSVIDMLWK